jgi:transcriptional regulator GlxA family with amidase domain
MGRESSNNDPSTNTNADTLIPMQVKSSRPQVHWEKKARWVVDGNVWTSSGISAGIDVTYAFVGKFYGEDVAQKIADRSEYMRNKDSTFDPFADMY